MKTKFSIISIVIFSLVFFQLKAQSSSDLPKKQRFLSLHAGVGYTSFTFRESNFEEVLIKHNQQWRNTYNYDLGIVYHRNDSWSFSLSASQITAQAKTENIVAISPTDTFAGFLEDDITLRTLGITAEKSLVRKEAFSLGYFIGLDYFYYRNVGHFIVDDFILDGGDFSFRLGAFFELSLSQNLYLNFKAQYVSSTLSSPAYEAVNPQLILNVESQDLSRMEFSLGIRLSLLKEASKRSKAPADNDEDYVPNRRFD
tara:strand:- start:6429 stop:7196 length:768 start_codon:yes stop_codon:yes gene_type:complete